MGKVFICYSHENKKWKDRLVDQLRVLEMDGKIDTWDDSSIDPGGKWLKEIENALNSADAAILIVTAKSLTSTFILKKEMPELLKRSRKKEVLIVPLIAEPCPWKKVDWLKEFQVLPEEGKPLSQMKKSHADQVLSDLAIKVCELLGYKNGKVTQQKKAGVATRTVTRKVKGRVKDSRHPKVVIVEEIAEQLGHRKETPHICHNDHICHTNRTRKQDCYVQRRAIGLAKEVANFDREIDGRLAFAPVLHALETTVFQAFDGSGMMSTASLEINIRQLFKLFGIKRVEVNEIFMSEDDSFLGEFKRKALSALDGKVGKNYSTDEVEDFIESLSSTLLGRHVESWRESEDYVVKENLAKVKTCMIVFNEAFFKNLKDDVESAYNAIHTAVKPFKEPPPEKTRSSKRPPARSVPPSNKRAAKATEKRNSKSFEKGKK